MLPLKICAEFVAWFVSSPPARRTEPLLSMVALPNSRAVLIAGAAEKLSVTGL